MTKLTPFTIPYLNNFSIRKTAYKCTKQFSKLLLIPKADNWGKDNFYCLYLFLRRKANTFKKQFISWINDFKNILNVFLFIPVPKTQVGIHLMKIIDLNREIKQCLFFLK